MKPNPLFAGYNVHPASDRAAMLKACGVSDIEDLFSQVPDSIRLKRPLQVPGPLSEWELQKHLKRLAAKNDNTQTHLSLLGGGAYEHYIPAVIPAIANRGEYLTAYTPYQPEMAQGLLRFLHDFQIMTAKLLGLPATNCSVYDGATGLAEAAWMAVSIRQVFHLAVAETFWPEYREVVETYMKGRGVKISWVPADAKTGEISLDALRDILAKDPAAAVLIQTPNRFGVVEPVKRVSALAHEYEALSVVSVYPMLIGCLESPGVQGADIVTCEAQPLGLALNAGGPYLGLMATTQDYEKYLPGRIVGECCDLKGEPALALVKEEREQHVSRDKATSHICSNQALQALRCSMYLALLGEEGFKNAAKLSAAKAHYLCGRLCELPGVRLAKSGAFFNEFLLEFSGDVTGILEKLETKGIFGGIDFSKWDPAYQNHLLIAVTEVRSKVELDRVVEEFKEALKA